ncbi:hypothetical protein KIW84_075509 [Lathyrus oleraceus]|uniref:Uncharacterized protein n=1 Tax=Pisum sativum TaxID=3888 RepID=A0A9D4ZZJ7_PEA|nr:hypothetical protein KIW84_075509 [Pisum sativum]
MLTHLKSVSRAPTRSIVVGGLITSLAIVMGLEAELEPLHSLLGSSTLYIAACHSQYNVRSKIPGRYTLMIDLREISIIVVLDPRRIDVRDECNWIFDIDDSKDEKANQLSPEGV